MRVLVAVILVWALLFAIPFAVYGSASTFLDLKAPVGPAWRFLCGVAVTKLGTTAAFVALFALSRDAWRGHWPLYGSIWFAMFAASEIGDVVRMATGIDEAILGILSEAVYAPASAFVINRVLR